MHAKAYPIADERYDATRLALCFAACGVALQDQCNLLRHRLQGTDYKISRTSAAIGTRQHAGTRTSKPGIHVNAAVTTHFHAVQDEHTVLQHGFVMPGRMHEGGSQEHSSATELLHHLGSYRNVHCWRQKLGTTIIILLFRSACF